jgi:hypothetical protein
MELNTRKLDDLVFYIVSQCEPSRLTKTQLHKTLWYAELNAFLVSGSPITGETYKKDRHGPVASHLEDSLRRLQAGGKIEAGRDVAVESKWEFIAHGVPNLDWLTESERRAVEDAVQLVCYDNTAASISRKSHDLIWKIASRGEKIPIETALVSELDSFTDEDIAWAHGVLAELE